MNIEGGPAAFLGALGVAGLAIGLAYGVHMVVPATDAVDDPGSSTIAMSDDFCTLMDELVAYTNDLNSSAMDYSFLFDETASADPAVLDGLHTRGQTILDSISPVTAYLGHGAELATDPAAAAAFETLAGATAIQLEALGHMALDAASIEAYGASLASVMVDADLAAASANFDSATAIVQPYVLETCGRDILANGLFGDTSVDVTVDVPDIEFSTGPSTPPTPTDPEEAAAMADANMLGTAIESYYMDWTEGDPQAVITVLDGSYFLFETEIGPVTEGNVITSPPLDDPHFWCVEVTPNGDSTKTYNYDALWGIEQGPCS